MTEMHPHSFAKQTLTRTLFFVLFVLGTWGAVTHAVAAEKDAPATGSALATVASLDVARYMGRWYEIARYPTWFQKKCVAASRAEYSLLGDGRVQVINRCRLEGGELSEAMGEARQIGPATSPKLEVRFAPAWLSFLPFVWGNYWVIDLDEDYQLAAVSEPRREYLWILSRSPKVDPARYQRLLGRLAQQGFDLGRLQASPQD